MKVCTCFLLFEIFAFTYSVPQLKPLAPKEAITGESKSLDNDNFKTHTVPKLDRFTDFIQETVYILNIFDDSAFEEFFHILDHEIRNYHYKGCKFSEITANRDTRSFLTRILKMIRRGPVTTTRTNINELAGQLKDEKYDNSVKNLLSYINSLYKDCKKKFYTFLNDLNSYRKPKSVKTHKDFVQVIRNGVRTVLFDHYTELDLVTRKQIIERIETFWNDFKQLHLITETDAVPETLVKSFEVSENETNEVKEPELQFKQDSQLNLRNKRLKIDSEELNDDHSKDKENEDDLNSNESLKKTSESTSEDLSSGQSFDSSSNSIKQSQERQQQYNTARYMTLYTEEFMPMKTEKTRKHKVKRLLTTTPSYRARDVIDVKILRTNQEIDEKNQYLEPRARPPSVRDTGKSRSKSRYKNIHMFGQYDAVVDVRLDNTNLLESLRMLAPDEIVKTLDTTPYPSPAIQRRAKTMITPKKPTAPTKSPLRHSISFESHHIKRVNESRKKLTSSLLTVRKFNQKYNKKTKKNTLTRRSVSNDTKDFNQYVIERIDALESQLRELRQMHNVSKLHENTTDEIKRINVTAQRKDMQDLNFKVERFSNTHQHVDDKNAIKENITDYNINTNKINTQSSSIKNNTTAAPNMIMNDTVSATVIENETTINVKDNNTHISTTVGEELGEETVANIVTSTDTTTNFNDKAVENEDTTPATEAPRKNIAYSQPAYYDYHDRRLDPFDHINDGLDLNM